ncbi:type IV secretory system conjugative DNA transfer family protein [Actinomadura geliboluensis]|uniref:type IV secretory system conjugative DNA transfer family protein n=1 Tax=Actinomadura geliboluensis TaxID=882440 RepID=UPI00371A6586
MNLALSAGALWLRVHGRLASPSALLEEINLNMSEVPEPSLPTDPIVDWLEEHVHLLPELPTLLLGLIARHGLEVLGLVITVYAAVASTRTAVRRWRNLHHSRNTRLIEIAVPPTVERDSAEAWWKHQAGQLSPFWKRQVYGQPHLAFEYVADENGTRFQVWVPGTIASGVIEKSVQAAWPGSTITTRPAAPPIPLHAEAAGGRLVLSNIEHMPLDHDHDADPLRPLLGAMAGLRKGDYAAVQILARPCTGRRIRRANRTAAHLRGGRSKTLQGAFFDFITPGAPHSHGRPSPSEIAQLYPERARQVKDLLAKAEKPRFEVQIRYAAATTHRVRLHRAPGADARIAELNAQRNVRGKLRSRAREIYATFALYSSGNQHLRTRRLLAPAQHMATRHFGRGYLLAVDELAALAHLPQDLDAPGVTRAGARPSLPSPAVLSGDEHTQAVRILGDSDAGTPRPLALTIAGARQHMHVLGQTGTGKSSFLAGQILADAHAGRGALVIDPKGDLISDLLERLPERVIGKTAVFDPAQEGRPPCINVLAGSDPEFAVEAIVTTFRRCFAANWGPRMDDLLRSACMTLVKVYGPNASLSDVPTLLSDPAYRARTVARLGHDALLQGFWNDYNELSSGGRAALTGPIMNKLRAVLMRPFVRDALSGAVSTVDLGEILNDGGLILARAAKGMLGEDASRLLGSLLLAHTWQAITPRAHLPEHARRDASAYIDEAHNFLNLPGSVSDILAEARAYRFSLMIAHQHLSQLPRDLRDAVSADARNKMYFAVSPEDAHALTQHTAPYVTEHGLSHLGAFQATARIIHNSSPVPAFTVRTRPLPAPIPGRAEAIRQASREAFTPADHRPAPTVRPRALAEPPLVRSESADDDDLDVFGTDRAWEVDE